VNLIATTPTLTSSYLHFHSALLANNVRKVGNFRIGDCRGTFELFKKQIQAQMTRHSLLHYGLGCKNQLENMENVKCYAKQVLCETVTSETGMKYFSR
jgi:hypothetical protein